MKKDEMMAYNKALADVEEHIEDFVNSSKFISFDFLLSKINELLNELSYTNEDMED